MELGRRVTFTDLVRFHPGHPERCICRGTAEIVVLMDSREERLRVSRPCERSLQGIRKQAWSRFEDTKEGPRWVRGGSPEEWSFALIFAADVRDFEMRERLRTTLSGCR